MAKNRPSADPPTLDGSPYVQGLAAELAASKILARFSVAGVGCEARLTAQTLWLVIRRPDTEGGLALRTAHVASGGLTARMAERSKDVIAAFDAEGELGRFRVEVREGGEALARVTTTLTPAGPLLIPFWPRDLYPLGPGDDPLTSRGQVLAGQRGFNVSVAFFMAAQPAFGAVLYYQNLAALNPWFKATGARPDTVVGGQWPELGYQPPAPDVGAPPEKPLPAGKTVILSDAFLHLTGAEPKNERAEAEVFLDGLAAVYPHIDKPPTQFRDWPAMARRTARALETSPKLSVVRYNHQYLRPYTDAEVPDSMVQLAVLLPVAQYGHWADRPLALERALWAGVPKFFDAKLGAIRRYLPNVAQHREPLPKSRDKDAQQVDSWYLYHPLANLGRLALIGDEDAKALLLGSLDYAIKVARHFHYKWPVLFNVVTLEVDVAKRKDGQPGQSDVGGLYAYVMLQAHELTKDERYLKEAIAGVRAMKGLAFDLVYQTNITAWGIIACAKLWKQTGERFFLEESLVMLAGFFHNTVFWESDLGGAAHYNTFLGATCLQDGPYMAPYECFECFMALRDYLELMGDDAPPAVRLLGHEYCRYALTRAWGFYPGELPKEILAQENRNGHIDRKLAIPLEDLYAGGDLAGQVGQETYGAGAAFAFATRAFHRRRSAPVVVFCDYPIKQVEVADGRWRARIAGYPGVACRLRIIPARRSGLPRALKVTVDGRAVTGKAVDGGWEADKTPGAGAVEIAWD
jgi:hypothetical protein